MKQTEILTHATHINGWEHELHGSKFPFVSRIEIIRSKLSHFFCSCIRGQYLVANLHHSTTLSVPCLNANTGNGALIHRRLRLLVIDSLVILLIYDSVHISCLLKAAGCAGQCAHLSGQQQSPNNCGTVESRHDRCQSQVTINRIDIQELPTAIVMVQLPLLAVAGPQRTNIRNSLVAEFLR